MSNQEMRNKFAQALNSAREDNVDNDVVRLVEDCLVSQHKRRSQ
mgnify:CR=1 FL=1